MIGFDEQIELFKLIGESLENDVLCYAIGGTSMLFFGLKEATKDIDLVFEEEKQRKELEKTLKKIGFGKRNNFEIYKHKEAIRKEPILLERKEIRFDLFLRDIISFQLSPGIKRRVKEKHEFQRFKVFIVSPEDILLLKSATDRKGDRIDAKRIIETFNINWDIIISESEWQTEKGRKIFSVFLYDFLLDLEDLGVEIPKNVIKKVRDIGEKKMLEILKQRNQNSKKNGSGRDLPFR